MTKTHLNLNTLNKISFIGAGNMAQAIIKGLINSGVNKNMIYATANSDETRSKIANELKIELALSNIEACVDADVIILAVKPQVLRKVCMEIKGSLPNNALVLSVAAGIRCNAIESWLGKCPLVRCMPNTPSSVGLGASGFFCNTDVNNTQKEHATTILNTVGLAIEVEEEQHIDAVTAVSGSGPAYFFLFIESMINAGIALGLNAKTAEALAIQTASGAAELAKSSQLDVSELRTRVTSPNGTTQRAIETFESNDLRTIVLHAMQACAERARELSDELGTNK